MNKEQVIRALEAEGVTYQDAQALRRVSMTLRRWYERERGTKLGCIERDEKTGIPYWICAYSGKRTMRVRDMETGALKRLAAIMARYPHLRAYIQGDPRGCALYILPAGVSEDNYHNGIAVY